MRWEVFLFKYIQPAALTMHSSMLSAIRPRRQTVEMEEIGDCYGVVNLFFIQIMHSTTHHAFLSSSPFFHILRTKGMVAAIPARFADLQSWEPDFFVRDVERIFG